MGWPISRSGSLLLTVFVIKRPGVLLLNAQGFVIKRPGFQSPESSSKITVDKRLTAHTVSGCYLQLNHHRNLSGAIDIITLLRRDCLRTRGFKLPDWTDSVTFVIQSRGLRAVGAIISYSMYFQRSHDSPERELFNRLLYLSSRPHTKSFSYQLCLSLNQDLTLL